MFHGAVSASVSNIEFSAARTSDRAEVRRLLRRRAKRRSIRRCRTGFHNDIFCPSLCGIRFWTEHCRPSLWSPLLFWSLPFSVWLPPLLLWSFSRLWQVSRLLSSFSWQLFALGSSPRRSSPRRWFTLRLQSRFRFHFHCQRLPPHNRQRCFQAPPHRPSRRQGQTEPQRVRRESQLCDDLSQSYA